MLSEYKKVFIEMFDLPEDYEEQKIVRGEIADWDSVGHMALVTKLEEKYDIMFEPEDILRFSSFDNGISILEKYGVNV